MRYVASSGVLNLGRQGENLAREFEFDFSTWKESYGDGAISLIAQRSEDKAPYPVAIKVEGTKAIWPVTNADTAYVGTGKCELRYTVDEVIVKSATYRTKVMSSLSGELNDAPAPQSGWVDEVLDAAKEVKGYAVHPPVIGDNGNWWLWDGQAYQDSGISSKGEMPDEKYVLIEEISIPATLYTNAIRRTEEPDGTPYNFKLLRLHMEFPAVPTAGSIAVYVNDNPACGVIHSALLAGHAVMAGAVLDVTHGFVDFAYWGNATSDNGHFPIHTNNWEPPQTASTIKSLKLGTTSASVRLPHGTKIKIYGVRA